MEQSVGLYQEMAKLMQAHQEVAVATIVHCVGSAPRGTGSQMAWDPDRQVPVGSVGGGRIEYEVLEAMKALLKAPKGQRAKALPFRLHPNQMADIGMICGGVLDVWIQVLTHQQQALVETLAQREKNQQPAGLLTIRLCEDGWTFQDASADTLEALPPKGQRREDLFERPLFNQGKTLVFGGGHVSQALVKTAQYLNFHWVVCDDRAEFLTPERFPQAQRLIVCKPDELEQHLKLTAQDQVCIQTRGHLLDFDTLVSVLKTPVRYIGLMGSRNKIQTTFQKLRALGFGEDQLSRIHAPIGLSIGARTPEEIAISILAELIADRTGQLAKPAAKAGGR